jgi:hypothetical protein
MESAADRVEAALSLAIELATVALWEAEKACSQDLT